jgi:hypothetical protein
VEQIAVGADESIGMEGVVRFAEDLEVGDVASVSLQI